MEIPRCKIWLCLTPCYLLVLTILSLLPASELQEVFSLTELLANLAHIPAYGILAFLLIKTLSQFVSNGIYPLAFLMSVLYGGVMEILQGFTGREPSWMDMGSNAIGALIVVLLIQGQERKMNVSKNF